MICSTLFAVEPARLGDYVKGLSDGGVAGMLVKLGRLLGTIPRSVLEVADCEAFPIASVPNDVLWSRVLESFYRHLLVEQTERIRVETEMRLRGGFFDELLSGHVSGEEVLRRAALLGCDLSGGGAALIFEAPDLDELVRKRRFGELQVGRLKTLLYETIDNAVREVHPNHVCVPARRRRVAVAREAAGGARGPGETSPAAVPGTHEEPADIRGAWGGS